MRRRLSNTQSCLLDVVWVEHLCCLHLRSLRIKLIFEFLGRKKNSVVEFKGAFTVFRECNFEVK